MIPEGMPTDVAYDEESYPNYFCCTFQHVVTGQRWIFEIYDGQLNQSVELVTFVKALASNGLRLVGFNNIGYDYPMLHYLFELVATQGYATAAQLWAKSQQIIFASDDNRFGNIIWDDQRHIPQVDLYKIHHFDNQAKRTSLKVLEFNMRASSVEDIPHDPNYPVTFEQARRDVLPYNCHDVAQTIKFYGHTLPMIRFRDELSAKYERNFTNHNDTKIGKDYFIMALDKVDPSLCWQWEGRRKQPRQTFRREIPLASIIFATVAFQTEPFQRVLEYLRGVTITNTKKAPELDKLNAVLDGFQFDFGTGGIHGSVKETIVHADDENELLDIDVASYYPNLAIKNRIYPQHLGETFCDVYADLYQQRSQFKKGTVENAMLKLALNGVYGDSNNVYSPFYDPAYTMAITINGQLLLCMLAEQMMRHPWIKIIQINTDGMTLRVHREARAWFDQVYDWWQTLTGLTLETAKYRSMFIRDVNNYIAVGTDGKAKRKGVYQWSTVDPNNTSISLTWAQDWSALVVPKAVEAVLVDGADLETFINHHADPFDFMMRQRGTKGTRFVLRENGTDTPLPQTVRYYVASSGPQMIKTIPQLAKTLAAKPDAAAVREFRVHVGWSVGICNKAHDFDWSRLDRRYYIEEARKLMGMKK